MNKCDDGGTAFPFPTTSETATAGPWAASPGMTLRDYFAAKAMPFVMHEWESGQHWSREEEDRINKETYARRAKRAYWIADAMLAARNEGSKK